MNVPVLALLAGVALRLARSGSASVSSAALFLVSVRSRPLFRFKAARLILAGGLLGILFG